MDRIINNIHSTNGVGLHNDIYSTNGIGLHEDLKLNGFYNGRMISHSKSFYRKTFPYNQVYFNANIFIHNGKEFEKIWYGDLDITKDGYKLKEIAFNNDVIFYVLSEMEGRFENSNTQNVVSKAVWDTGKDLLIINKEYIDLKEKEAHLRNLELLKKQKKQKKLNIKENKTYKIKKVKTILNHKIIKKIKVKSIELEKLYKVEKNNFLSFLESKDIDLWDKRKKIKEMKNLSYVFLENLIKKKLKTSNELNLSNFWGTTKLLNKFNKKDLELENSLINKYNSLLSEDDKKDNMELELRKEINHYYLAEYTIELANKDKININSFKDDTIYVLDR